MRESTGRGLLRGIGIYEPRVLCMTETPEVTKAYYVWSNMLQRANPNYVKRRPSYAGTIVDPSFVRFSDFYAWVIKQHRWGSEDAQLDKDLLSKGNRIYGPDTCVLLPQVLNSILTTRAAKRGIYPIGVTRSRNGRTFTAKCCTGKINTYLGVFDDPEEAFAAYKGCKEAYVKQMAEMYRFEIDPRAYDALMAYQIEITD